MFAQISFAPRICHNMLNLHLWRFISLTSICIHFDNLLYKVRIFLCLIIDIIQIRTLTPLFSLSWIWYFCLILNLSCARLSDNDYTFSKINTWIRSDIFINNKSSPFSILLVCYYSISWAFRPCPMSCAPLLHRQMSIFESGG